MVTHSDLGNEFPFRYREGAVIGGHDEDDQVVYIAKIGTRFGFYDPRETEAEYGTFSASTSLYSPSWDFLVVTYGEFISCIHDSCYQILETNY